MTFQLKRLEQAALEAALSRAERYRAQGLAEEAESIARDVLAVDDDHQGALRVLGHALTEQLARGGGDALFDEALAVFARLGSEYERVLLGGVAWERRARREIDRGGSAQARAWLEQALGHYAHAQGLTGEDDPEPVLRWNRCVRLLARLA